MVKDYYHNKSNDFFMNQKILIFTSSYDKTCDYLIKKYSNVNFFRFNLDFFSTYDVVVSSDGFIIKSINNEIDSLSCKSIYFRKPVCEILDGVFDDKYHPFVHRETYSLIEGITESFFGRCLTKPSIMRRANNKVFQAILSKKIAFNLPNASITNDKNLLTNLKDEDYIVKPLSTGTVIDGNKKEFVQTNIIDSSYDTSKLKYSPIYLQEYINKDYEVRVTFINNAYFPVKIVSENNVDWRKPNNKVTYQICEMPNEIVAKCFNFLNSCDMIFGCFDFLVKDNEWYFLEMNANGQWAWLEFEVGCNISDEIVGFLNE